MSEQELGGGPVIEFAPHLNLDNGQRHEIELWKVLHQQVEARAAAHFVASRIIVNGASYLTLPPKKEQPAETPLRKKLLMVSSEVFYRAPDGHETSYHVGFIDDVVVPLIAFRAAAAETMKPKKPRLDDFYVLMVKEQRYGMGAEILSMPGGMAETGTCSLIQKAREEAHEETGMAWLLSKLSDAHFKPLGAPFVRHAAMTDRLHCVYAEIDCPREEIEAERTKLIETIAGNAAEGEKTRPAIVPLREAFEDSLRKGHETGDVAILLRYMRMHGLFRLG